MAEQKRKSGFKNMLSGFLKQIMHIVLDDISGLIEDSVELTMLRIENKLKKFQRRFIRKISSVLLIMLGGLFFVLAFLFFLIETLMWSKTISFLVIGFIILILGFLLKEA